MHSGNESVASMVARTLRGTSHREYFALAGHSHGLVARRLVRRGGWQEDTLDEVIVTAQFRSENLQDTPFGHYRGRAAISSRSRGSPTSRTSASWCPNASIRPQGGFSGPAPQIGMRGVQTTEFIYTTDPGVGVYIDDIYFGSLTGRRHRPARPGARGGAAWSAGHAVRQEQPRRRHPADLQGTKGNDTGGLEVTYGTSNRLDLRGTYDFAMTDKLFVRITGVSKRIDGYQDVLDFPCEMKKRGTPGLSGTLPSLVPSNREQAGDCRIAERGGIARGWRSRDAALSGQRQAGDEPVGRLHQTPMRMVSLIRS